MTRLAVGPAVGAGIAAVAWFAWHQTPLALADPAACPGLVEAAAVAAALVAPAVPLSSLVAAINAAGLLLTTVGFVGLFDRVSGSLTIAAAITATALATPLFRPALAPASTIALGAVCWAAIAALRRRTTHPNSSGLTVAGLGVTAAVAPSLTTACALAAAGETWLASASRGSTRRWLAALLAAAIVVASAGAAVLALPSLVIAGAPKAATCSPQIPLSRTAIQQATALPLTAVSPLLISLAALGLFLGRRQMINRSHWPLAVGAVVPCLIAGGTGPDSVRAFAPVLVALWALAAVGLRDFTSGLTRSRWNRAGALACVIAVPALQLTSRADWLTTAPSPAGHEVLSRRSFVQIVNVLESDSVLVEEDTLVDLLERSIARPAMAARRIRIAPRRAETIAALLADGARVVAMPLGQRTLQDEGFQLRDHPIQLSGGALADVLPGGACESVGAQWISADGLSMASSFALIADDPHDRGPISVYLSDDAPLAPSPQGWPDLARRGFFGVTYDRTALQDRQQFDDDFAAVQGPADPRLTSQRFVAYLELWRVPGAPLRLVVAVGRAHAVALVRTRDRIPASGLRVCPSFSYRSGSLAPQ